MSMKRFRRFARTLILALLLVSLFVPTLLLSGKLVHLNSRHSEEVFEDLTSIKYKTDILKLDAVAQEGGGVLREPSPPVYENEVLDPRFSNSSSDESHVLKESERTKSNVHLSARNETDHDANRGQQQSQQETISAGSATGRAKDEIHGGFVIKSQSRLPRLLCHGEKTPFNDLQNRSSDQSTDETERELPSHQELQDSNLHRFAVFSDNVLACAVVVDSTVSSAMEPEKIIFHVVTDSLNFAAISMWFLLNPPGKAIVQIQNMDNFDFLSDKYVTPVTPKHSSLDKRHTPKSSYLRFYLPDIFPKLEKILLLDHDVVVQKDLTGLWGVDLKGKVNASVLEAVAQ